MYIWRFLSQFQLLLTEHRWLGGYTAVTYSPRGTNPPSMETPPHDLNTAPQLLIPTHPWLGLNARIQERHGHSALCLHCLSVYRLPTTLSCWRVLIPALFTDACRWNDNLLDFHNMSQTNEFMSLGLHPFIPHGLTPYPSSPASYCSFAAAPVLCILKPVTYDVNTKK